jgi:hypothetical protein
MPSPLQCGQNGTKRRRNSASVGIECGWNGPSHVAMVVNNLGAVRRNADADRPPRLRGKAGCGGADPREWNGRQLIWSADPPSSPWTAGRTGSSAHRTTVVQQMTEQPAVIEGISAHGGGSIGKVAD